MSFREISPEALTANVFDAINKTWILLSSGDKEQYNTMTASWGGMGILWNRPVAFVFVRPSRFTYGLMEKGERFSLSFLPEQYRAALNTCGSTSGRDGDKFAKTGLTPVFDAAPYVEQAHTVLLCKKLYTQDFDPARFLDPNIEKNYNGKDYHRMYVGEITRVLVKE